MPGPDWWTGSLPVSSSQVVYSAVLLALAPQSRLSNRKGALTTVFAIVIFAVAIYTLIRSLNLI